jgi:hypothetical protein
MIFFLVLCCVPAQAQKLIVISWNLESGESSDTFIANRVKTFQGIDLWGLSEVANDTTARIFEEAAEDGENADFRRILSTTGGGDRLAIVYNATRFQLISKGEIHRVTFDADQPTPGSGQRSPLMAELQDTQSGKRFLFIVNHFARTNDTLRRDQAKRFNDWVRQQTLPVVAVGDYNFDWRVENGDQNHDAGFDFMTADQVWKWVRPGTLVMSQCNANENSVLDFVFVNPAANLWQASSVILQEAGDCQDDNQKPDHRPLKAEFELGAPVTPPAPLPTRAEILQRIEELERQILALKELVRRLPN